MNWSKHQQNWILTFVDMVITILESHSLNYHKVQCSSGSSGFDWDLKHNRGWDLTICTLTSASHLQKQKQSQDHETEKKFQKDIVVFLIIRWAPTLLPGSCKSTLFVITFCTMAFWVKYSPWSRSFIFNLNCFLWVAQT